MENKKAIFWVKFIHSVIYFFMVACLIYIFYCALIKRYDWTLVIALAGIFCEGIVLLFNRFTCPFTNLAEKYGAEHGAITDLFLPQWCAKHTFSVSTIIFTGELIWLAIGYFTH